ncbi:MAG: hypothetical protein ACYCZN_01600 [Candidatus Dormibacteria bacterium]
MAKLPWPKGLGWTPTECDRYLVVVATVAQRSGGGLVEPDFQINECLDPEDNLILAAAEACGARLIISSDHDLLELTGWHGIATLEPKPFVKRMDVVRRMARKHLEATMLGDAKSSQDEVPAGGSGGRKGSGGGGQKPLSIGPFPRSGPVEGAAPPRRKRTVARGIGALPAEAEGRLQALERDMVPPDVDPAPPPVPVPPIAPRRVRRGFGPPLR